VVYDYVEKADLTKGYQNPKRKLGATTHFSETNEVKFGKKLLYILCINAHYPHFFFLDFNNPC